MEISARHLKRFPLLDCTGECCKLNKSKRHFQQHCVGFGRNMRSDTHFTVFRLLSNVATLTTHTHTHIASTTRVTYQKASEVQFQYGQNAPERPVPVQQSFQLLHVVHAHTPHNLPLRLFIDEGEMFIGNPLNTR